MRNLFDIKDRVMVITGGTGVLGTSMTEYLADQGAKMVVLGRNKEKGDTYKLECQLKIRDSVKKVVNE